MGDLRQEWGPLRGTHAPQSFLDWLDDATERLGDWRRWPEWARAIIRSRRANNRQRWQLFMFFTRNGVDPDGAADLIRRAVWTDDSARRQLIWLAEHHLQVQHRYSDARVFDLNNKRPEQY